VLAAGRVVVLNGTSSAGKTSTAKAFQELRTQAGECWTVNGMDDFMPKLPRRWIDVGSGAGSLAADGVRLDRDGDCSSFYIGEEGQRLLLGYRRFIGEAESVHRFPTYDLELDSTSAPVEQLAREIDAFVPQGLS
jgi:chloramphenicol 3-O-phosphotransferase